MDTDERNGFSFILSGIMYISPISFALIISLCFGKALSNGGGCQTHNSKVKLAWLT